MGAGDVDHHGDVDAHAVRERHAGHPALRHSDLDHLGVEQKLAALGLGGPLYVVGRRPDRPSA